MLYKRSNPSTNIIPAISAGTPSLRVTSHFDISCFSSITHGLRHFSDDSIPTANHSKSRTISIAEYAPSVLRVRSIGPI